MLTGQSVFLTGQIEASWHQNESIWAYWTFDVTPPKKIPRWRCNVWGINWLIFSLQGETPLHTACRCGLPSLTAELLQQGANPNLQTQKALPDDSRGVALQTPLHMAIADNHPDVVSVILEQKGEYAPQKPVRFKWCLLYLNWVYCLCLQNEMNPLLCWCFCCSKCTSYLQQFPDHSRF